MHIRFVAALVIIVLAVSSAGCKRNHSSEATLVSITITPADTVISTGTSTQFTAIGSYSDNTTRDVTALASWSCDNQSKTSITSSGLAKAIEGGEVMITATIGLVTQKTTLTIVSITLMPSSTIFSKTVTIETSVGNIDQVNYTIYTKPGNKSKDVNVTYSHPYLEEMGYVNNISVQVPVFGLYAGYLNNVAITVILVSGAAVTIPLTIQTVPYTASNMYTGIRIEKPYDNPAESYFLIDASHGTPVIIDIDGEVRWLTDKAGDQERIYMDDLETTRGFFVFDRFGSGIKEIGYDENVFEQGALQSSDYSDFHHNIEPGKQGMFACLDYTHDGKQEIRSVLANIDTMGNILESWHFQSIIGDAITQAGEDPSGFAEYGLDWFHMNSAIYDSYDDSAIISSRENFILKVDYSTKKIKWILGNPGKMWYQQYPLSLRPFALTITGKAPIGQHSLSLIDANHLLLSNNGFGNENLPYVGDSRTYSAVSLYEIDEANMTANEVLTFTLNQQYFSPYCGSVYQTESGNYLVDFSTADNMMKSRILIIDPDGKIKFSMAIPARSIDVNGCDTAYRAKEIKLENFKK
jgi:hypothetical protein